MLISITFLRLCGFSAGGLGGVLGRWTWGRGWYRGCFRARVIIVIFIIMIKKSELTFQNKLGIWIYESAPDLLFSQ